jgi:hypothetical protein
MKNVKFTFPVLTAVLFAISPGYTYARGNQATAEFQEIFLESPVGSILAAPSVAGLLAKAGSMRQVFISRIVVDKLSDGNGKEFCIELKWSGGDVIGTFAAIAGSIQARTAGPRQPAVLQVNANLVLMNTGTPGYPACPSAQ